MAVPASINFSRWFAVKKSFTVTFVCIIIFNRRVLAVVDKYKIIKVLGEGQSGRTLLAEHAIVKKKVVLKQFYFKSEKVQNIILAEASMLWEINHWALPAIKDVLIHDDGSVIMTMSYVAGDTLLNYVQENGPLELETVCWIIQRILSALYYLHFMGIVHKDVKPVNIIVNFSTHIATLVDFGFSRLKADGTPDNNGLSFYYKAPEQIEGKAPTPQSDIYSLGMTIIYLIGGNIKTMEIPDLPGALKNFIFSLTQEDPLKRPSDCLELNHELGSIREKLFDQIETNNS